MAITDVDFTDEIAFRLEEILAEHLPEEFAAVAPPLTPLIPADRDSYRQGSILLWMDKKLLPLITIEDEPPGGVRMQSISIGTDETTGLPAIEGSYTFLIHYALEFRKTELVHRVVRKAIAAVVKILWRHAVVDVEVGWKNGKVPTSYAGRASVQGSDIIFCIGTCRFECEKYVVPDALSALPGTPTPFRTSPPPERVS